MNTFRFQCCPFCQSRDLCLIGPLVYGPETKFVTQNITLERTPELWRCAECDARVTQNAIPPDIAAELYRQGRADQRWSRVAFEDSKSRETVALLSALIKPGMRILDVGCNTGEFLDFAKGLGAVTAGVEPSKSSRDQLEWRGHNCVADIDDATGEFDMITLFDVIEHTYQPRELLQSLCRRLTPGGRFVILTGEAACAAAKASGPFWWYAQYPEHVVFPTVEALCKCTGTRVETRLLTFAKEGYRKPIVAALARSLFKRMRGSYGGLPAPYGDHMMVVLARE